MNDLRGRLNERRDQLASIFEQAQGSRDETGGSTYDLMRVESLSGDSGARVEQVRALMAEIDDLKGQYDAARAEQEELAGMAQNIGDLEVLQPHPGFAPSGNGDKVQQALERKSLGQLFVESQAFKGFHHGGQSDGPVSNFDLWPTQFLMPGRSAVLFETAVGWAPESLRLDRVEFKPLRPAPQVVDAIPDFPTGQATIKYMEETTHTDNAAEVNEGGVYGEAAFVLTERSQDVEKIGTWLPVTDEQLEDELDARAFVDNRLAYQLRRRIDGQVLVGNGTAPNLLGTENKVGIQTQALGTDPLFDAAFKLFRKIRDDGFAEPSVFYIAPSKWESVALTRTTDGVYILGNPAQDIATRLWGIPGIQTTAHTATKLIAGDYVGYSGLYVRKGVNIQVGYQSDDFIKGRLAIRADVRVAMVHFRPKAFGNVTGL